MRELKFRIWSESLNKMWFNAMVGGFDDTVPTVYTSHGLWVNFPNNENTMQYTGLKDKNGVEIYEGDIIISRDDPSVVVWSDDMACYLYENPRWSKNQHGWHLDCDVACEVKVIGNIHQDPELLT